MKPLRPIKVDFVSPGPAAHSPVSISKIKASTPAYSLGRRWIKDVKNRAKTAGEEKSTLPTPGPGQCNVF
jgi:hypothetical protein